MQSPLEDNTFFFMYRKIIDSAVFGSADILKMWVFCLAKASYKPRTVALNNGPGDIFIKIEAGQFVTGRKSLGKSLKIPPSTAWDRLRRLEKLGNITINTDSSYSVVTICNWGTYQTSKESIQQSANNQPTISQQPVDNQPTTNQQSPDTNNKVNKVNKVKKGNKENSPPPKKEKETDILKNAINDLNILDQDPSSTMEPDDPEYDRGIEVETPRSKQIANNALLLTNCFLSLFTGIVVKRTTVVRYMRALLESVTMTPGDIEEYMYRKQKEDGNTIKIFDLVSEIQEMCGVGGKGKSKKGVDHSVLKKFMESQ